MKRGESIPLIRRLLGQIQFDIRTHCWIWLGVLNQNGYGRIEIGGRTNRKNIGAHRISYMLFNGPLDPEMTIDHLCRRRHCVNPDHLEQVSRRENTLRGESPSARHARQTNCIHGHALRPTRKGTRRYCPTCQRLATARWMAKQKERSAT